MKVFASLNRQQREAVGLLQIGTFLEYFDLMLYVHMAILLNELFFPNTDPHTTALLAAFAFCSTYVLRPFGALLFGWIGDNIGRKPTVIITTMMMALSCIIMANLPTYAQIGVTAAWVVTFCRILQGLSSMGEVMGAKIYITEIVAPPTQHAAVSLIVIANSLGTMAALGVAMLVTSACLNWRIAFWVGATIAALGSLARIHLRETAVFLKTHRRLQSIPRSKFNLLKQQSKLMGSNLKKDILHYSLVQCGWPCALYLAYIHFNSLLKTTFGYSTNDIITHNFLLSFVALFSDFVLVFLSMKVNPLKILKIKGYVFFIFCALLPLVVNNAPSAVIIFILQSFLLAFAIATVPADAIFIKRFPVLKRFTHVSFIYAITRAAMYVITSFGLVIFTEKLGTYGVWVVTLPTTIGFLWGVHHFDKLETQPLPAEAGRLII